jgi:hypothetical protein
MHIQAKSGREIPVYPSPWSVERKIDGVRFEPKKSSTGEVIEEANASPDLEDRGLIGSRSIGSDNAAGAAFSIAAVVEAAAGAVIVATGPVGYALQVVKMAATVGGLSTDDSILQYEINT